MPGSWGKPWLGHGTRYGSVHAMCTWAPPALQPQEYNSKTGASHLRDMLPFWKHSLRHAHQLVMRRDAARDCLRVCVSGNGSALSSGRGAGAITWGSRSPFDGDMRHSRAHVRSISTGAGAWLRTPRASGPATAILCLSPSPPLPSPWLWPWESPGRDWGRGGLLDAYYIESPLTLADTWSS